MTDFKAVPTIGVVLVLLVSTLWLFAGIDVKAVPAFREVARAPARTVDFAVARTSAEEAARRRHNKVIYLHVQKTGGSTICNLAKTNGHHSNFTYNCIL